MSYFMVVNGTKPDLTGLNPHRGVVLHYIPSI